MHFPNPILQAFDNKARHQRMVGVNGVAAAGVVAVYAFIMAIEMVENIAAQATEIDNRPIAARF